MAEAVFSILLFSCRGLAGRPDSTAMGRQVSRIQGGLPHRKISVFRVTPQWIPVVSFCAMLFCDTEFDESRAVSSYSPVYYVYL